MFQRFKNYRKQRRFDKMIEKCVDDVSRWKLMCAMTNMANVLFYK